MEVQLTDPPAIPAAWGQGLGTFLECSGMLDVRCASVHESLSSRLFRPVRSFRVLLYRMDLQEKTPQTKTRPVRAHFVFQLFFYFLPFLATLCGVVGLLLVAWAVASCLCQGVAEKRVWLRVCRRRWRPSQESGTITERAIIFFVACWLLVICLFCLFAMWPRGTGPCDDTGVLLGIFIALASSGLQCCCSCRQPIQWGAGGQARVRTPTQRKDAVATR